MFVKGHELKAGDRLASGATVVSEPEDDEHLPSGHLWVSLEVNGFLQRVVTRRFTEHQIVYRDGKWVG